MKLQPDTFNVQSITGYGPGWVAVDGEKFTTSLVLSSRGEKFDWQCTQFDDLTPEHFARVAKLDCELVIFGSGSRIRFPPGLLITSLMSQRIGLETMDTQAACRTYNILAGEGRHVALALLQETRPS